MIAASSQESSRVSTELNIMHSSHEQVFKEI